MSSVSRLSRYFQLFASLETLTISIARHCQSVCPFIVTTVHSLGRLPATTTSSQLRLKMTSPASAKFVLL